MRRRNPAYGDYRYENGRYVQKDLFERIHDNHGFVGRLFLYPIAFFWYIIKFCLMFCTGMFFFVLIADGWKRH